MLALCNTAGVLFIVVNLVLCELVNINFNQSACQEVNLKV